MSLLIILRTWADRLRATRTIATAPFGTRLTIKGARRTLPQNDLMWSMLGDIAEQQDWHGRKLPPESWKRIFVSGLRRQLDLVPNLDGTGWVDIGGSTREMEVDEMSQLIELMRAWGHERGMMFINDRGEVAA